MSPNWAASLRDVAAGQGHGQRAAVSVLLRVTVPVAVPPFSEMDAGAMLSVNDSLSVMLMLRVPLTYPPPTR